MSSPNEYGAHYWCITGDGAPVFLYADRIEVTTCGALVAWGGYRRQNSRPDREQPLWAAAPGTWKSFYAASLIDGHPVALEQSA